eukprot:GHVU01158558.1.p1 GENE.GHVU01158558.1~~GHVU01158558.1.p1  ORF type:complete len:142 (+),score=30.80 GHVU01158558.1:277-702(+)
MAGPDAVKGATPGSSKIFKGCKPSPSGLEIGRYLEDLQQNVVLDDNVRREIKLIQICDAQEIPFGAENKKCVVVKVPYAIFMSSVKTIRTRLVQELEKKTKKFVVIVAHRKVLNVNQTMKGLKIRPRTRTITHANETLLVS